jgi:hypothetical protein
MNNLYMKRQILIIILLAVMNFSAFACDCTRNSNLKEAQKASFEESDLVFIGEVVSLEENLKYKYNGWFDNRIFEIEVIEGFKGATIGDILKGRSLTSCSAAPERINFDGYVVRPPMMEELENPQPNDDLDWAIELATFKLQAAKDLKEEVIWLRTQK